LLAALDRAGLESSGCDLDLEAPNKAVPLDRIIKVNEPWALPSGEWQTIVMLDVLEHHPDPVGFLKSLDCSYVALKVPTATGPAAWSARKAAKFGKYGQLEQLFLAGENAPHFWLATPAGLAAIARRAGWEVVAKRRIPEVGRELPDRMRPQPSGVVTRAVLSLIGIATASLGRFWSDTQLVVLRRIAAS
jgi:hypothetical protein